MESVLGVPAWESPWIPDADTARIVREDHEAAARGLTTRSEFSIRSGDSVAEVDHTIVPIFDETGAVEFVLPCSVDVTARNAALRGVGAQSRRLRELVDALPVGIFVFDAERRVVDSNAVGRRLFHQPEALPESPVWPESRVVAPDGSETPLDPGTSPVARALAGAPTGEPATLRVLAPEESEGGSGDTFVTIEAVPLRGEDGAVEGAVLSIVDVTELREVQARVLKERLQASERLQATLDGLNVLVGLLDPDGRIVYANDNFLASAGRSLAELEDQPFENTFWSPDDGTTQRVRELLDEAVGDELAECAIVAHTAHGTRDYELAIAPIRTASGAVRFLIASATDATERNEARAQAEAERRRLHQIVAEMPVGLMVFDTDRRVIQANDEALSAMGLTLERFRDGDYPDGWFVQPDGSEVPTDLDDAPLRRALRGESGREERMIRLRGRGDEPADDRFVRAEAAALRNAEGEIDGAVFTVSDVKPLREAETALLKEREAATARLQATLDTLSILVGLLDLEGRVVYCNRAPLEALGVDFETVRNVRVEETPWFAHDPEMANRVKEATRIALSGHVVNTEATSAGIGGVMDLDMTFAPVRDVDGAIIYLLVNSVDVTARNAALREVARERVEATDARISAERAKEAAERASRAKDEFLSVLSHELRTPLTPAMLGLELMEADLSLMESTLTVDEETVESIRDTFGTVRTNLDLQVRLIDDLLDITRIARGKLELHKTPTDLHAAAGHALDISFAEATEKDIELVFLPDAGRATVFGDPARLRQVLWNLVANAVKFTPRGRQGDDRLAQPEPRAHRAHRLRHRARARPRADRAHLRRLRAGWRRGDPRLRRPRSGARDLALARAGARGVAHRDERGARPGRVLHLRDGHDRLDERDHRDPGPPDLDDGRGGAPHPPRRGQPRHRASHRRAPAPRGYRRLGRPLGRPGPQPRRGRGTVGRPRLRPRPARRRRDRGPAPPHRAPGADARRRDERLRDRGGQGPHPRGGLPRPPGEAHRVRPPP